MKKSVLACSLWISCSVFDAGALFADLQGSHMTPEFAKEKYRRDMGFAYGLALFGPLTLPVAIFGTGFLEYGWRLK